MPVFSPFRSNPLPSSIRSDHPKSPTGKQPHVLVVDDVRTILEVVTDVLRAEGFTVESTTNPAQAVEWLGARPDAFDAIVSDLDMPYISGPLLLKMARQLGFTGKTIIHSGSLTGPGPHEKDLGTDAVVEKPFGTRSLPAKLWELLT